jgi:preprotein translocase subunit SecF
MFIVKYKAFFIGISALLVVASCVLFGVYGIKKGIDFTGGTTIEISYLQGAPETLDVQALKALNVDTFKTSSSTYKFITTKQYDELGKPFQELLTQGKFAYFETQVNTVGPTLGREMTKKAAIAIVIVILAILAFIAFAFREVSRPVSSLVVIGKVG